MNSASIPTLLKQAVQEQQVKISLHAAEEALAENITRLDLEAALLKAQVLENYPEWWLGPACLIYGSTPSGRPLHLVVSCARLPVTIITVYKPGPPKWVNPITRGEPQ